MVTTSAVATQADAPWGLSRISHRKNGSVDYVYDSSAGEGTYSYIIDTGILIDHVDFGGRASWGANFADDGLDKDGNGHGTHVAGTTGGTTYGVAKKTNLIAVKVLNSEGKGSTSNVISGIEWAVKDASSKKRQYQSLPAAFSLSLPPPPAPISSFSYHLGRRTDQPSTGIGKAVANLSVGGPYSRATNEAAAAAVKAGLFLAVAAGNDGSFAGLYSPASESTVCTVAASTSDDSCADFSNFGYVVDIFAPGVGILSAWHNGTTETNVISGTSMATPHIAGLAAYMLAMDGPRDPVKLCERIRDMATPDVISNLGLLPELLTDNLLAYNGISA